MYPARVQLRVTASEKLVLTWIVLLPAKSLTTEGKTWLVKHNYSAGINREGYKFRHSHS